MSRRESPENPSFSDRVTTLGETKRKVSFVEFDFKEQFKTIIPQPTLKGDVLKNLDLYIKSHATENRDDMQEKGKAIALRNEIAKLTDVKEITRAIKRCYKQTEGATGFESLFYDNIFSNLHKHLSGLLKSSEATAAQFQKAQLDAFKKVYADNGGGHPDFVFSGVKNINEAIERIITRAKEEPTPINPAGDLMQQMVQKSNVSISQLSWAGDDVVGVAKADGKPTTASGDKIPTATHEPESASIKK